MAVSKAWIRASAPFTKAAARLRHTYSSMTPDEQGRMTTGAVLGFTSAAVALLGLREHEVDILILGAFTAAKSIDMSVTALKGRASAPAKANAKTVPHSIAYHAGNYPYLSSASAPAPAGPSS